MSRDRNTDGTDRPVAPDDEPVANEEHAMDEATPHDAVGAYVLDGLPEDERLDFEAHLSSCPDCQREAAELRSIALVLPRVLEIEPAPVLAGGENGLSSLPEPSRGLRARIIAAAREDDMADDLAPPLEARPDALDQAADIEREPALGDVEPDLDQTPELIPRRPTRPPRRIMPGAAPQVAPTPLWQSIMRRDRSWLAAAALAVVAVSAIIWALALLGRVDDKDAEIAAQETMLATREAELAAIRREGNATVALLGPTGDGPETGRGTLFLALAQDDGVLLLEGMAQLPEDQVYQLWYLPKNDPTPKPGPTFRVSEDGAATVLVSGDVQTFGGVALTAEPDGGSDTPTQPILMTGELGGARG